MAKTARDFIISEIKKHIDYASSFKRDYYSSPVVGSVYIKSGREYTFSQVSHLISKDAEKRADRILEKIRCKTQ